jgi:hypothetical protein
MYDSLRPSLTLATCLLLSGVACAQVTYESFEDYSIGSKLQTSSVGLNYGENWSGPWDMTSSFLANEYLVVGGGLTYSNGSLNINGGNRALQYVASEGGATVAGGRPFASTGGTTYMSFLYNNTVDTGGSGNDFIQVGLDPSITNPRTSALDRNSTFQARRGTGTNAGTGITSTTGQTFFLVAKVEKNASANYNEVSLFVDPTSTTEPGVADAVATGNSGISSVANLALRKAFNEVGDTYVFDEFRIGSTFAEVTQSLTATSNIPTDIVFEDQFGLDPGAAGAAGRTGSTAAWTESVTDTGSVDGDIISAGGGLAQFASDVSETDFDLFSITRTIDATNFTNLFVDLSARDDADNNLESSDILDILINTGSGFTSIYSIDDDFNDAATQGSLVTSPIALPMDADLSTFDLRIEATSNVEDYFLDRVSIFGQAEFDPPIVPEPSTVFVATLGLLGMGWLGWRRRKRE